MKKINLNTILAVIFSILSISLAITILILCLTVSYNVSTYAEQPQGSVNLEMLEGASIRLNNKNGIRFYTKLDIDKIEALKKSGYIVELGTLISPLDLLGNKDLTFDLDSDEYLNIKYESDNYYVEDDFKGIVGSIVDIKETSNMNPKSGNITRDFVGRGYAKITKGNETKIIYAKYAGNSVSNNTRSLSYISKRIKDDSTVYNSLSFDKRSLVDKWASY